MSKIRGKKSNFQTVLFFSLLLFLPTGMGIVSGEQFKFLPEAEAQVEFEPYVIRNATTMTAYHSETRGTTTMGLPEFILTNEGDYVPYIFIDDVNGAMLESATSSYYFDYNSCTLSNFEKGRVLDSSPIIQSNSWVVKVAQTGTDTWSDVSTSFADCSVEITENENGITLNSTKIDTTGILSEVYEYTQNKGLKTTVYFTNNEATYNDHKFSFSNILQDTPKSFNLVTYDTNSTEIIGHQYSQYTSEFQPFWQSGNATVLDTSFGEIVEFEHDELVVNGTVITSGFTWLDKEKGIIDYTFDIGIEKLWALKFVSNTDNTLDVYIDYANVGEEVLPVGETTELDPTVQPPESDYMRVRSWTTISSSSSCRVNWASAQIDTVRSAVITGNAENCYTPVWKYDISAIPDTATPVSITFSINATSNYLTSFFGFGGGGDIRYVIAEDLFTASTKDVGDVLYNFGQGGAGDIMSPATMFNLGDWFVTSGSYVGIHSVTLNSPNPYLDVFEDQMESGKDYFQLVGCRNPNSTCSFGTNYSGSSGVTFADEYLEVEWEQFTTPEAPQNLSVTYSDSPDKCSLDWDSPLDSGGRPITGYQIKRSTGASYQILVADTGGSLPTAYDDTSIISGISYTYIVNAITLEGVGEDSLASGSCGIPESPDSPILDSVTNIGIGIVALDWTAPTFDGNTPVVGYKIERTSGSPQNVPDNWTITQHNYDPTYQCQPLVQLLDGGIGTGYLQLTNYLEPRRCAAYFYAVFDTDVLDGKTLDHSLRWGGSSPNTNKATIFVVDGVVKPNVNFPFQQPFISQVDTTGDNIADSGAGIIQTVFTSTTLAGAEAVRTADTFDLQFATQPQVTLMFRMLDSGDFCGGACDAYMAIHSFDIGGVARYDMGSQFGNELNGVNSCNPCSTSGNFEFNSGQLNAIPPFGFTLSLDGFAVIVPDTGNTNTEYIDNAVVEETTYGYRVSAINAEGTSDPSNLAIITTSGLPATADPPTVTPTGTQSITVDWVEPDLKNSPLDRYVLERKQGVSGIWQIIEPSLTTTTYDDGSGLFTLQPATEYCYRVEAFTSLGSGGVSGETCATTFDAPAQVENLTVTAIDGSSVNMSFETPLSDGGSPITGYKVERKIGAGSFVVLDALTQIQFRNDTGLPIGTLITYRVSASNAFGFGDTATASDTTDATPQVPQNLVCSASTPDSINLSWATPLTFSPPTGYQISRNIDGGVFSVLVADTASTGTTYNDVTLSLDTIYGYQILAHTAEGDTLLTDPVYCQTLKQPDSPPENFKAEFSQTIPHDVILTWDLPNTFGVPITSITVERDDGAGYVEIAVLPPNAVGMVDTEPDNDVDQKYRIKMTGSLGDSKYGYAIPSDLNRVSHFNFEKTISDSGDQKNSATVSGIINFAETGHAGTRAFDYDGASYIIVDVAQESDYDFERTTPFGGSLYYKGSASLLALDDNWYATNHKFCNLGSGQNGCDYQPFALSTNANGYNAVGTTGGSVPSVNDAYQKRGESILFKTFDKSDLDGKTLHIDWNGFNFGTGAGTCTGIQTVGIYDGEYSIADGGVADFPDGSPIVMKGAGLLQTLNTQSCILGVGGNWSFDGVSATIDLSSATDPSNKVTLMFIVQDNDSSNNTNTFAPYFIVTDLTLIGTTAINERIWDFTSTLGATYTEDNPTTCIRDCGLTQSTEIGLLGLQALLTKAQTLASIGWAFYLDEGYPVFRMNGATQSIEVKSDQFVTTDNLEHLAFTTNGNSTGAGVEIFVNGTVTGKTIVTDTLTSESILNNEPLVIGATSTGTNILQSITDEIMIFSEDLDDGEITEIANDQIETVAPINATMTLTGSTFANISSEEPEITLISGFPLPNISGNLELKNFTTTTVNSASGLSIPASGVLNVPALFNQMGSLSNYTAIATLDNGLEVFVVISNEDLQSPLFTLPAGIEFFFQQQRINNFEDLSFNFTKTSIPFDLACNLKSELFEDGITYEFENVGFLQEIFDVPRNKDVVVACIDQNSPLLNPDEPSFGGSNALLTFVSFGDTTGIGAFLNFTDNYGDFFGAPLPYLFIILAAALFTGRSAPTGIIVIGIALGIMWYLGILVIDPVLWGIIVVLVILGAIGGKKFL